jgi:hypothetical protein
MQEQFRVLRVFSPQRRKERKGSARRISERIGVYLFAKRKELQ